MKTQAEGNYIGTVTHVHPLLSRIWFQLYCGLIFCVFMPAYVRLGDVITPMSPATANNAAIGAAVAFTVGYYFIQQLGSFPGVRGGSHVLVSVTVPFALVAIVLLLLRLEYSRVIFATSFVVALIWFLGVQLALKRWVRPFLSVLPGGHTDELYGLPGVYWHKIIGLPNDLNSLEAVVADLRHDHSDEHLRFLTSCSLAGVPVYHSKQMYESLTGRVQIEHMSENSIGSLTPSLGYLKVKQVLDWLLALLALPLFLLLCVILVPMIVVTSGWPAFYVQQRVGYRGKRFNVYKFRTMTHLPDGASRVPPSRQDAITRERDNRVTALGAFLRKYRIDELPQILNILKGEMSWIGPRPEAVPLAEWYDSELAFYAYRHVLRPGISGWAQVNQGHVSSPAQVLDKLHYDFFYIKYCSPWLDLLIGLRTIRTVLGGFGAK